MSHGATEATFPSWRMIVPSGRSLTIHADRDALAALDGARAGAEPPVHPASPVARSTGRSTPHRGSGAGVTIAASGAALRAGDGLDGYAGRSCLPSGVAPVDRVEGSLGSGE